MSRSSEWRNLAICGHASAGKTTLVDRLLAEAGAVPGTPSVADQTSVCDFDEEEKAHGHSIESAVVHLRHGQSNFNAVGVEIQSATQILDHRCDQWTQQLALS